MDSGPGTFYVSISLSDAPFLWPFTILKVSVLRFILNYYITGTLDMKIKVPCALARSVPVTVHPLDFCNDATPGQNIPLMKDPHNFCDNMLPNPETNCPFRFSTLWSNFVWNKFKIFYAPLATLAPWLRGPGPIGSVPLARFGSAGSVLNSTVR
jgi:hypothetical protein